MNFRAKDFGYSTKNIPLAGKNDYLRSLIHKTESLIQRMRWKAHFFLNGKIDDQDKERQTYGFKSKKPSPIIKELCDFEDSMLKLIQNVNFKTNFHHSHLQRTIQTDINELKDDKHVYVKADKTTNFYKTKPDDYLKLLDNNVTKTYKKTNPSTVHNITTKDKEIATSLHLDDRIESTAPKTPFITLKDHKPDFANKPTCRLINPTKSDIGKISKQILDRINHDIITKTGVNLWRSTNDTLDWFKLIPNKEKHSFITFDVCEFYPSITENLLNKALNYASNLTNINKSDRDTIIHAKKSLLHHLNNPWTKRDSDKLFDVTMGSYDGAETCELIGLYMLSLLKPIPNINVGLYRDDGLIACRSSPREVEKIKKQITKIFHDNGLKITIDANKKIINFLDVTFNLSDGTYKPYMKPNNKLLYVHSQSNHPPQLLKNIPMNINRRLTNISSNETVFNETIAPYQKALDESGYKHKLTFDVNKPNKHTQTNNRKRNITWYNPPWNTTVKTNVGRKFLNIVKTCFHKDHPLHKIFNKNTLKLSYSCMPNVKSLISSHNKKTILNATKTNQEQDKKCNCRKKDQCPLDGNCQQTNVIYQATVSTDSTKETYVGLASNFKQRYTNHKASFRHNSKRNETELSKHIWTLKDDNIKFNLSWKIIRKSHSYSNETKQCQLCLNEKFIIICKKDLCSLNKRNELASSCPHRNRFILKNVL